MLVCTGLEPAVLGRRGLTQAAEQHHLAASQVRMRSTQELCLAAMSCLSLNRPPSCCCCRAPAITPKQPRKAGQPVAFPVPGLAAPDPGASAMQWADLSQQAPGALAPPAISASQTSIRPSCAVRLASSHTAAAEMAMAAVISVHVHAACCAWEWLSWPAQAQGRSQVQEAA